VPAAPPSADVTEGDVTVLDVVIVGAGVSGVGAAWYLAAMCPSMSFAILEARDAIGGTWDLFRYPGVRSDSDLHTFGYEFKPWRDEESIASASAILGYVRSTAAENGIDKKVLFGHKVVAASWSSAKARWLVEAETGETGERALFSARWIFCASGYYDYAQGYAPRFEGQDRFLGRIVHPQHWPDDLDYAGKKVVVIGSGATAVTLVPAMAGTAAQVTMLQRTPTYILTVPSRDAFASRMRKWLSPERAYAVTRWKNINQELAFYYFCQRFPRTARRFIRGINVKELPAGYPVDVDFNPPYSPWDQRVCLVPDSDLFHSIKNGTASITTDSIKTFTETGIALTSGRELQADLIVTATGLNILPFGGVALSVDGVPAELSDSVAYKGMMLTGIPNFAFAIGYTNSSWTLKIGLVCEHFCRLLGYMREHGFDRCEAVPPGAGIPTQPLLNFGAGYVQRSLQRLPKQGLAQPWLMPMNYRADVKMLRKGPVADPSLSFTSLAAETGDRFCDAGRGIRLCYRTSGDPAGEPLLLIAGLGLDLTSWPTELIDSLLGQGFYVITFDNRDAGRSTHLTTPAPGLARQFFARPPAGAYDLGDMALDAVGLLDHLGLGDVHVAGMSMGGMIAQTLAARYPARVRSLTSIFSTTGSRKVGQPAFSTMLRMASGKGRTMEQAAAHHLLLLRHIGSDVFPPDADAERAYAARAWARGKGTAASSGEARQIGAIHKSADRTTELRRITAPTLVIHGDRDLMVAPSGGQATARAIANARFVQVPGLRHHIAPGIAARLAKMITEHAAAGCEVGR
jgi:cation diffusion facilitator CzcD-associated flavoprotein CzcO/pimeloyl-ACP methyl ester carboxylesterase